MAIPCYMAATARFTPANNTTDLFCLGGSNSRTIRVLRLILSGTQTTGGNVATVSLIKRSAANTGSSVAATAVPLDSASPAATAQIHHYTTNPSALGTAVGTIWNGQVLIPAPASVVAPAPILEWLPGEDLWLPTPVLRANTEFICINLGGSRPTGAAGFGITALWAEE